MACHCTSVGGLRHKEIPEEYLLKCSVCDPRGTARRRLCLLWQNGHECWYLHVHDAY